MGNIRHPHRKIYRDGPLGVCVPFREVTLSDSPGPNGQMVTNPPVHFYDTAGPGADAPQGLPPLRREWVLARGDVEEYPGRTPQLRDDGRSAAGGRPVEQWRGERRLPLRAKPGCRPTQLHYARAGHITPEMAFVAVREGLDPELIRQEIPPDGPSCQPTSTTPRPNLWPSAATYWSR